MTRLLPLLFTLPLLATDWGFAPAPLPADSDAESGVMVYQVRDNSPAAHAGLRAEDLVLRIDGESVADPNEAWRLLAAPAKRLELQILRDGSEQTLILTAVSTPGVRVYKPTPRKVAPRNTHGGRNVHGLLGLNLTPLSPSQAAELGLEGGLLVRGVLPHSPGRQAGLQAGDVLTRLNEVSLLGDPAAWPALTLDAADRGEARLTYIRAGERRETTLRVESGSIQPRAPRVHRLPILLDIQVDASEQGP